MSPTYPQLALPLRESPPLHLWIMLPAIALAAMTFALVWLG
jgi:hypothetical protein